VTSHIKHDAYASLCKTHGLPSKLLNINHPLILPIEMKPAEKDIECRPLLQPIPRARRARARSRNAALVLGCFLSYLALSVFLFPSWLPFGSEFIASLARSKWHKERMPLAMLEEIMLLTPQEEEARQHSEYYTSGPHLGGKNLSQAIWTKERWEEYGIPEVEIVTYDIYTNYPKSHRLGLLKVKGDELRDYELLYEASLEEPIIEEDPTTALEDRVPTFHGYSANGNVTAEFVYANYGTYVDFQDLLSHGVNVTGKVVLCKYGNIFRGLKVKRAQDLGAVGVLIYSDPGDDGIRNAPHLSNAPSLTVSQAISRNSTVTKLTPMAPPETRILSSVEVSSFSVLARETLPLPVMPASPAWNVKTQAPSFLPYHPFRYPTSMHCLSSRLSTATARTRVISANTGELAACTTRASSISLAQRLESS
jgi:hypothetical protein